MEGEFRKLLELIGEDGNREGLKDTPLRAANAFKFLTSGYGKDIRTVANGALFESDNDEMVIVKDIEFYSLCEHHMLPFFGRAHVGYIPKGKMIGLSKIPRLVDMFAQRLQTQERMTKQIADALYELTRGYGVGVVVEGQHLCMKMRGVKKQGSSMKTSAMLGTFRSLAETRNEFLSLIQ
jgi:GTP cyclohydrolase I|tara:strand:+ start:405 stop:944 length:540 start_codon:yes stop_codon:yes gene_type:complete